MTKLPNIHELMQGLGLAHKGADKKGIHTYEPPEGANSPPPLHRLVHNGLKKSGYQQVPGTFPLGHRGKERFYTKGQHGVYVYSFHDDTPEGGGKEREQTVRYGPSNFDSWW
jgi:hypothetical protein